MNKKYLLPVLAAFASIASFIYAYHAMYACSGPENCQTQVGGPFNGEVVCPIANVCAKNFNATAVIWYVVGFLFLAAFVGLLINPKKRAKSHKR